MPGRVGANLSSGNAPVSDASTHDPDALVARRARMRQERQARVGILRNPNQPPRPPARRAALMGKWPNLRSSRRASAAPPSPVAAPPDPPRQPPVLIADDGTVARIDVDGLMASVDVIAPQPPLRQPFAAEYRADVARVGPAPRPDARPSILSAEAWLDDDDDAPIPPRPPAATVARSPLRAVLGTLVAVLAGMLVAVTSLLALFGPPG